MVCVDQTTLTIVVDIIFSDTCHDSMIHQELTVRWLRTDAFWYLIFSSDLIPCHQTITDKKIENKASFKQFGNQRILATF